jgi:uncharacterized membrane protein
MAPKEQSRGGWKEYWKGSLFALPLAVAGIAMLLLKFSLWGGALPPDTAMAVSLGTFSSFVVSGGFVQAMSRQGLFHLGCGQFRMCEAVTWWWVRAGMAAILGASIGGVVVGLYFGWLSAHLSILAAAQMVALGGFWLACGALYMLERELLVGLAVALGIACVVALHSLLKMELVISQLLGICVATAVSLFLGGDVLQKRTRQDRLATAEVVSLQGLLEVAPYFAFGALYYLLMFADRVIAWTAGESSGSLPLRFRNEYEAAMDAALFAFILQVGWVRYAATSFRDSLQLEQERHILEERLQFNAVMRARYLSIAKGFPPIAFGAVFLVWIAVSQLPHFATPAIQRLVPWSMLGSVLLVWSLWNVSLLFLLSRPSEAVRAAGAALAVNVMVGYLCSRIWSYEEAAAGLIAGGIVFAAYSTRASLRTFRKLDYFHYASAL